MFSRLADLELFRSLHHDNIVSLLGVCYTDMLPGAVGSGMREQLSSFRLLILFDKCDTNLEEYVFNNPNFQCGNISQTSRTEASDFFCRTAQAICSAMFYIHWKGIVHTKIQLKNVLLQNGKVKLCGPTCAPDTNIDNGTKFSAPEDLAHKNIGKHTDIFNLGTLLWELWYGRRAAVDLNKGRSPTSRPHPDCNTKHAMPENLARVVQSCWAQNPEERPDASVLLKEI
ncbi:hypothetical protein DPMN_155540 [Dreissena polymorpha]|uniref:Protein kinase domain-containing protein n=1 Tax=Dreissena polymorpha TaxID=45954 RepID=A0A9D4FN26_DREPO|nr:hypothetical protein DPMN_155540 [Dreissena polymorpha]